MATKLGEVFVAITGDSSQLDRDLNQAKGKVSAFGNVLQGILQGVGQRLFTATSGAISKAVGAIDKATSAASDLNETINKTSVVFGSSARDILEWSKTTDTALGQSQQTALEAASAFGNLFTSLGTGRSDAAEMSRTLVELASDLASFNNIDPTEALEKLRAGIVGETEPLRTLGVFLNETVVKAKAVELGFEAVGGQFTEQQKVMARYAIILQQTANAQGDFARTSDDLANAARITDAQFQNLNSTLGQAFLPIKTAFVRGLGEILTAVQPFAQQIIANFARGLASAVRLVTPALLALRQLFVFWLKPGSPPRLLPELVEWGTSAASEWIKGWTKADVGGLQQLGSAIESILRSFATSGNIKEIDLVGRIFGSQQAILEAINEFRELGSVSTATLDRIRSAAGPAGGAVAGLVGAYFDLANAARETAAAQQNLNDVTSKYDEILSPLQGALTELQRKQRDIQLQQEEARLKEQIGSSSTDELTREAARLRLDEIRLQRQIDNVQAEKDAAVGAAEEKLDAAKAEEQAQQDKFDAAQALLDQQVKYNNLIGEQRALEDRIAKEREAAAKAVEALAKQQIDDTDAVAQAQLRYRLAVADTAGDLEILRGELAKTQVGSVEYYDLLTQIAQKEQELQRELAQGGAGSGALPGLPDLASIEESANGIKDAFDGLTGDTKAAIDELVNAIGNITDAAVEVTPGVEKLAMSLDGVVKAIGALFGIDFSDFTQKNQQATDISSTYWFDYAENVRQSNELAKQSADESAADTAKFLDEISSLLHLFADARRGDWAQFWRDFGQIADDAFVTQEGSFARYLAELLRKTITWIPVVIQWWRDLFAGIGEIFGGFFTATIQGWRNFLDSLTDFGSVISDMYKSGQALVNSLWDGLKTGWEQLDSWLKSKSGILQGFRNLWPFSEPKDPSSPLRGFGKSGEALMQQFQAGMDRVSLAMPAVQPAAVGGATTNDNRSYYYFDQVIGPNGDPGGVRDAARRGILDAKRARGQ